MDKLVELGYPKENIVGLTKGKSDNYKKNKKGERGKYVEKNFIYSSDTNKDFLSIKEIKKLS